MKLSSEQKKNILKFLLKKVADISDKEYQKRVWIQGQGPEVDDFDETTCHILHEGEAVLKNYREFQVTELKYRLLKKLILIFRIFSDNNDFPEEFIDTPEWTEITEMAKEVLQAFNYKRPRS